MSATASRSAASAPEIVSPSKSYRETASEEEAAAAERRRRRRRGSGGGGERQVGEAESDK